MSESLGCRKLCGRDFKMPNLTPDFVRDIIQSQTDFKSYHILNRFGQVLYSQFLGKLSPCRELEMCDSDSH